jgi:hypothetical protein
MSSASIQWAVIVSTVDIFEAELISAQLNHAGIDAHVGQEAALCLMMGTQGESQVLVSMQDYDDAMTLLQFVDDLE